jgi:uncharacterized membrane protein
MEAGFEFGFRRTAGRLAGCYAIMAISWMVMMMMMMMSLTLQDKSTCGELMATVGLRAAGWNLGGGFPLEDGDC